MVLQEATLSPRTENTKKWTFFAYLEDKFAKLMALRAIVTLEIVQFQATSKLFHSRDYFKRNFWQPNAYKWVFSWYW